MHLIFIFRVTKMHGLALASEEFVKWSDLPLLLLEFARYIGVLEDEVEPFHAAITVTISACKGSHAYEMFNY